MNNAAETTNLKQFLSMISNQDGPLNEHNAKMLIGAISDSTAELMRMCFILDIKQGYVALGYQTYKECIEKELKDIVRYDYANKLKNAGYVHTIVCPEVPMGAVPPGRFRLLQNLADEDKQRVWNTAKDSITPTLDGIPTPASLRSAVRTLGIKSPNSKQDNQNNQQVSDPSLANDFKSSSRWSTIVEMIYEEILNNLQQLEGTSITQEKFDKAVSTVLEVIGKNLSNQYQTRTETRC